MFWLKITSTLGWALATGLVCLAAGEDTATTVRLATFSADVTVPAGHGMMGGAWLSKTVADSL
ncbi:MAG: hypothetical protein ACP5UQ_11900, partial [Anaerolineae bacterium]